MINYSLPSPIKGYVREKFLYDMDATKTGYIPAKVIGFSSYPGHALTLTVLLDDGSLFCYLPFDAFTTKQNATIYFYDVLVYHNCPEGELAVSVLDTLPEDVHVFLKKANAWVSGKYVATIDWYTGNDLLHLVLLSNGQLAAMPNHKVKFGASAPKEFPAYKKIHQEWVI